jgi:uncharacterized protein (DUF302 family)
LRASITLPARAQSTKELRATQVLLLGNPKIGTALMLSDQRAGLDLPIRVAAWHDEKGQIWIAYNAPTWLANRHGIDNRAKLTGKMSGALDKLTSAAAN